MAQSTHLSELGGSLLTEELLKEQAERIAARRGNGGFGRAQSEASHARMAGPSLFERLTDMVQETVSNLTSRKQFKPANVHERLASRIANV